MKDPVRVYGVGTSAYGKQPHLSSSALASAAVTEAFEASGVERVDAAFVGTVFGASGVAQRALGPLGIVDIPIVTVENACASGTTAFHEACSAVAFGRYEHVLALGVEHMSTLFAGPIVPEETDSEGATGLAMPAMYAMAANRYRAVHGLTDEQMAWVAVKNYRHALGNPRAQRSGDFTVEEVLNSRMIADPLTVLQCSPISDGAAAAVVGPPRAGFSDVAVRTTSLGSGSLWDHRSSHVWSFELIQRVAGAALDEAGVDLADIDVLEVHDAFTIGEIVTTEAIGMAEEGGGGALAASGFTSLGGAQPVNPSGGLLGRGHPLGATGLAQIAEVVWQLQGRAGTRQVDDARLGLVETMGGGAAGVDGNACVVAVLEGST